MGYLPAGVVVFAGWAGWAGSAFGALVLAPGAGLPLVRALLKRLSCLGVSLAIMGLSGWGVVGALG